MSLEEDVQAVAVDTLTLLLRSEDNKIAILNAGYVEALRQLFEMAAIQRKAGIDDSESASPAGGGAADDGDEAGGSEPVAAVRDEAGSGTLPQPRVSISPRKSARAVEAPHTPRSRSQTTASTLRLAAASILKLVTDCTEHVKVLFAEHGGGFLLKELRSNDDAHVVTLGAQAEVARALRVPEYGYLLIRPVQGMEFFLDPASGRLPKSPYVYTALEDCSHSFSVAPNVLVPEWNDPAWLAAVIDPMGRSLELAVYDWRIARSSPLVGSTTVPLADLASGGVVDIWVKLRTPRTAEQWDQLAAAARTGLYAAGIFGVQPEREPNLIHDGVGNGTDGTGLDEADDGYGDGDDGVDGDDGGDEGGGDGDEGFDATKEANPEADAKGKGRRTARTGSRSRLDRGKMTFTASEQALAMTRVAKVRIMMQFVPAHKDEAYYERVTQTRAWVPSPLPDISALIGSSSSSIARAGTGTGRGGPYSSPVGAIHAAIAASVNPNTNDFLVESMGEYGLYFDALLHDEIYLALDLSNAVYYDELRFVVNQAAFESVRGRARAFCIGLVVLGCVGFGFWSPLLTCGALPPSSLRYFHLSNVMANANFFTP